MDPVRQNYLDMYNHKARKETHPAEYQPVLRVPIRIASNSARMGYWCHLCCSTRLDDKGIDLHYAQAHPNELRDVSSRLLTTYAQSRHYQTKPQVLPQDLLPARVFKEGSHSHPRLRRPFAQSRPVRYTPTLLSYDEPGDAPPIRAQPSSSYDTIRNTIDNIEVELPSAKPNFSPRKRRRTSEQQEVSLIYQGNNFDEETDSDSDSSFIPHNASGTSEQSWEKILDDCQDVPTKVESDLMAAVSAGLAYAGKAQNRTASPLPVDVRAASETASNCSDLAETERLLSRMFEREAELREVMFELRELVISEGNYRAARGRRR